MPAPILLLALAAGGAAFALSKKSPSTTAPGLAPAPATNKSTAVDPKAGLPGGGPAASTLPGAGTLPPPDVLKLIATALTSANPIAMRAAADELEKAGFAAQAADLRAAALAVEKATAGNSAGTPSASSPGIINTTGVTLPNPVVLPNSSGPVSPPAVVPSINPNTGAVINLPAQVITATDPRKDQAAALALALGSTKRFKENKTQVTAFQQANMPEEKKSAIILGKPVPTADGLYGTTTALTLARVYGIVPPAPFYYPTNPAPAKTAYKKQMAAFAASDPQRADEWTHAGESVTNM